LTETIPAGTVSLMINDATADQWKREYDRLATTRPEPRQTDDLLWQEIFSLREKVKIAVAAVKSSDPKFDDVEFTHRLNSVDYDQLMEELSGDIPEPRQTTDDIASAEYTRGWEEGQHALMSEPRQTAGEVEALIDDWSNRYEVEMGGNAKDELCTLLARKGE